MKRIVMYYVAMIAAIVAVAEPTVTDVVAKQWYLLGGQLELASKVTGGDVIAYEMLRESF